MPRYFFEPFYIIAGGNKSLFLTFYKTMFSMRRIYTTIMILAVSLLAGTARAQSYFTLGEIGFSVGGSQYFGDLNEHYGFKTVSPAYGIYFRRKLNSYIALKAVANYTTVSYSDKYNSNIPFDVERNLSFTSPIAEFAAQAEFNFFRFITGDRDFRATPYLTGGIGVFYYNPYTTYGGVRYDLQPLGTEGQNAGYNRKYSNYAVCFPIGAGAKYWLRPGVNLALEIADRLTTTDYIDDVSTTYVGAGKFANGSVAQALQNRAGEIIGYTTLGEAGKQRGNSSSFDQYLMVQFSISFNFTTYRCPQDLDNGLISTY